MKPVRHAAHESTGVRVLVYAAALITTATAGFLVDSAVGWAAAAGTWAVVLIAWWLLRKRGAPTLPGPVEPQLSAAHIEEVIERLDHIARERNWSFEKCLGVARMACEYRNETIHELGRRYDEKTR
jgi:hypothetical protein